MSPACTPLQYYHMATSRNDSNPYGLRACWAGSVRLSPFPGPEGGRGHWLPSGDEELSSGEAGPGHTVYSGKPWPRVCWETPMWHTARAGASLSCAGDGHHQLSLQGTVRMASPQEPQLPNCWVQHLHSQ